MMRNDALVWRQIAAAFFWGGAVDCDCHCHQQLVIPALPIRTLMCECCRANHPLATISRHTVFVMN